MLRVEDIPPVVHVQRCAGFIASCLKHPCQQGTSAEQLEDNLPAHRQESFSPGQDRPKRHVFLLQVLNLLFQLLPLALGHGALGVLGIHDIVGQLRLQGLESERSGSNPWALVLKVLEDVESRPDVGDSIG